MRHLKLLWQLFDRSEEDYDNSSEEAGDSTDRMARDIKGTIFSLFFLFELIAFTSYIPLDSFQVFQGRIGSINNLGGIVGALLSEWFLGSMGAAGYSLLILTGLLALVSFQGGRIRDQIYRILGLSLGTFLTSILLFMLFHDLYPEASLLRGGLVGTTVGQWLLEYLNSTGSLVLLAGGYLITAFLTTGFSLTDLANHFFKEEDLDEEDEEEVVRPRARKRGKVIAVTDDEEELDEVDEDEEEEAPKAKKKPARKSKAKKAATEEESDDGEEGTDTDDTDEDGDDAPKPTGEFEDLIPFTGKSSLPSPRLLMAPKGNGKKMSRGDIKNNSRQLVEHLLSFQITGEIVDATQGPVLTTYEYKPSAGMKLSKIASLQDDLGIICGSRELRVIAPIPGKTVVGIEVPREKPDVISLKEVLSEKGFWDKKLKIPIALGKATDGTPLFADLTAMPHLLVAGATGSGKSVFVNCLIMSLLYRMSPQELRLILVDPKMLELNAFDGLPHLITPVITNNNIAYNALNWAVQEMDRRYKLMAETGSKNIDSYNGKKTGANRLPYIVIIVDELADLMMSGGEAVEIAITRLAQKARAAGIHMVIATQRPSTDVITGLIKANIPSRISFKVPSGIDSRTILDTSGAEDLIGRGDSLMIQSAQPIRRMHACFVTEEELKRVVKNITGGKKFDQYYLQFPETKPEE